MIIKQTELARYLREPLPAFYILTGQDHYLLDEAAHSIKTAWRKQGEGEEKVQYVNAPADWNLVMAEANSYSLFVERVFLDVRYDKKSLDSVGKKTLHDYLERINPSCVIMLRAPSLPNKQLQGLAQNKNTLLVTIYPLSGVALQRWIATQLQNRSLPFDKNVPELIHQYTQQNMLATAQVIEKLALVYGPHDRITASMVMEHLTDQCEYSLYALSEACLSADAGKAIHVLRKLAQDSAEPTLILWLLTQEIRQLIQLSHLMKQGATLSSACNQLKIWSQRVRLYEMTLARVSVTKLHQLLQLSQKLDTKIKSSQISQVWQGLEQVALVLCLGSITV